MKPRTERVKRYQAKLHHKRRFMHIHLGKELRKKFNIKKRSLLVHKGDKVKIMRGSFKGKSGKIMKVDYNKGKVYVEAITTRTARGKELSIALELSNLLLLEPEMTKDRNLLFKEFKEHKAHDSKAHEAKSHDAQKTNEQKITEHKVNEQKANEHKMHENKAHENKAPEHKMHENKPAEHPEKNNERTNEKTNERKVSTRGAV